MDILRRLYSKIDLCAHGTQCQACCWPWIAGLDGKGYPKIGYNRKVWNAVKLLFALKRGTLLTEKYYACHTCNNKVCCNDAHVYQGTHASNAEDYKQVLRCKGAAHHSAKMTALQVEEARQLYDTGAYTVKRLCTIYPVKRSQMQRIVRGHKWR